MFEWNLLHHRLVSMFCLDLDGVLCVDPAKGVDDDSERYLPFLAGAQLLHQPTMPIGWNVTCRLEKDRAQTEVRLGEKGIAHPELVMMDCPNAAMRRAEGRHAAYKKEVYRSTRALWFIEAAATKM